MAVPWEKAIQAWFDGKTISLKKNGATMYAFNKDTQLVLNRNDLTLDWHIEDQEEALIDRFQLLKSFEELHKENIDCNRVCDDCDYLMICDMLEQMLEREWEQAEEEVF